MVKMKIVKKPYIVIKKAGAAYEYAGVKVTSMDKSITWTDMHRG